VVKLCGRQVCRVHKESKANVHASAVKRLGLHWLKSILLAWRRRQSAIGMSNSWSTIRIARIAYKRI